MIEIITHIQQEIIPVNLDAVTVQDCLDLYNCKDKEVLLNDGRLIDIVFNTESLYTVNTTTNTRRYL